MNGGYYFEWWILLYYTLFQFFKKKLFKATARTVLENYSKLSPADKTSQLQNSSTTLSKNSQKTSSNENISKTPQGYKLPGGASRKIEMHNEETPKNTTDITSFSSNKIIENSQGF